MHNEWTDLCILDNNIIKRKSIDSEKGTYHILNNELIINWDKWQGDDIFILFNDCYYHKIFYNKYIINKNLISSTIYYDNYNYDLYINLDNNYLFKKFDITNIANYSKNNNIFTIKWHESIEEIFININEKYYNDKYIIKLLEIDNLSNNIDNFLKINNFTISKNINKESKKIEKFKKINNNLYFTSSNNSKKNNIKEKINNNLNIKINYKIIDLEIDYNNLKEKVESLLFENKLTNKNYLNKNNIDKYLNNISKNKDVFNNFFNLELNFEIPIKKNKRVLTLVEWAYPPFGGGENWILNFTKILHNNNYDNFIICFADMFKSISFTETKLINLDYVKIIQMPKDIINIIKIIKVINPDIINHQGVYREYFMKISNLLEIPFLTGFCFWQNIVKFNMDNINVNMINNNGLERTDEFEIILNNSYTYSSSDFVNDIIEKLYNKKLDVIETISLKEDFYIDNSNHENNTNKIYVTLINCHYNKGGYLIEELCNNLNINIPLQLVYTENDPIINIDFLTSLINKRNEKNNINKLIKEKVDVKIIYNKTKIVIIPSICDETFCRVGYEAMINKIPIISSSSGNLKYLLKDYALFIDNNIQKWSNEIEKLYFNDKALNEFKFKNVSTLNEEYIEKKILNKINNINESKYKLSDKNVGLIIPWADQGLGIQGREYYISIKNIGYNPYVLSFKPYHATHENIRLQTDKTEWDYENILYSHNYREDLTYDEIIDFVYKYNIKKVIIIEATYIHIFRIAMFLKLLNIKIYLAINLECTRLEELDYHYIFDKIITNNLNSHLIMSRIFNDKIFNLGFHLNHNYFQNINRSKINEKEKEKLKLKFFCTGGFNAISRKNIDLIVLTFYNIFNDNLFLNWELNVYIQGVQIPESINKYKCDNIKYHVNNLSYKLVIDKYFENNIFIHMGSHEGLGIGFYESIYCGTPILTMDWIPNSEIIIDNKNGWLTNCSYSDIYDNDNSLLNKGIINEKNLKKKITEIIENKGNTINIINNSISNIDKISKLNKSLFENNFLKFLSE